MIASLVYSVFRIIPTLAVWGRRVQNCLSLGLLWVAIGRMPLSTEAKSPHFQFFNHFSIQHSNPPHSLLH